MTDRSIVTVLYALGMGLHLSTILVSHSRGFTQLDKFKEIQYDHIMERYKKPQFWKLKPND